MKETKMFLRIEAKNLAQRALREIKMEMKQLSKQERGNNMWIKQGNYWLNLSQMRGLQVRGTGIVGMPMDSAIFSSELTDEFDTGDAAISKMAEYAEMMNVPPMPCWMECVGNKWMNINSLKAVAIRKEVDEWFVMGTVPGTNVPGVRLWGPFVDKRDKKQVLIEVGQEAAEEMMDKIMVDIGRQEMGGPKEIERKPKKTK